jgi:hypothetical protein
MDGTRNQNAKWNNPVPQRQILHAFSHCEGKNLQKNMKIKRDEREVGKGDKKE